MDKLHDCYIWHIITLAQMKLKRKECKRKMSEMSLEFVQGLFEMEDINKFLKFNAINPRQIEAVERFERQMESQLKNLCVPDYQTKNA